LAAKGVPFAFSTQEVPADKFRDALRQVIEAGLSKENALRALTTDAARILGVSNQVGGLEKGKAAHLLVMDGDLPEADAQVKYCFSDGVRFEYETKARPRKPSSGGPTGPGQVDEKVRTTELDADRAPKIKTKGNVLLRGATLLTITDGVKPNTDLLVIEGQIRKIRKG